MSTSVKHRQVAHLSNQLALLASRAEELEKLMVTTAEQANYMSVLGAYHASWFMACGKIMTPQTNHTSEEAEGEAGEAVAE